MQGFWNLKAFNIFINKILIFRHSIRDLKTIYNRPISPRTTLSNYTLVLFLFFQTVPFPPIFQTNPQKSSSIIRIISLYSSERREPPRHHRGHEISLSLKQTSIGGSRNVEHFKRIQRDSGAWYGPASRGSFVISLKTIAGHPAAAARSRSLKPV